MREGKEAEAAELLTAAEELRPKPRLTCDGQPVEDMRDLDDFTASFFEVLTSTGKYYWIPIEKVEQMELHPPERPRDLLWRRVHMVVAGGPDGEVFLPTLYVGSHEDPDDQIRLGRATSWREQDTGPVRGVGQRMYLVGEETRSMMEIGQLHQTAPS